jgi:hypothetical protein
MEIKSEEVKEEKPKMRQILIETDGINVHIRKAEVSGSIEFNGILSMIYKFLNTPNTDKSYPKQISRTPAEPVATPEPIPVPEVPTEKTA